MYLVEIRKMLETLGWRTLQVEGPTFVAEFHLPDRFADVFPFILRTDILKDSSNSASWRFNRLMPLRKIMLGRKDFMEKNRAARTDREETLRMILSLSTSEFNDACRIVDGDETGYYPLVDAWDLARIPIETPEILEKHVRDASEEAVAWARRQKIDQALEEHASQWTKSPDAWPVQPVRHLAALALLGDVRRLKRHRDSFDAGDRTGFPPQTDRDCICRALTLAERKIS